MRVPWLTDCHLFTAPLHGGRGTEFFALMTWSPPKGPPPNTTTVEVGFQHRNFKASRGDIEQVLSHSYPSKRTVPPLKQVFKPKPHPWTLSPFLSPPASKSILKLIGRSAMHLEYRLHGYHPKGSSVTQEYLNGLPAVSLLQILFSPPSTSSQRDLSETDQAWYMRCIILGCILTAHTSELLGGCFS